jgi:REP element-mobilizing transposase RayT
MQLNKENRAWSLLRYQVVCCSKNLHDIFEEKDLREEIRTAISSFFESMKNAELIQMKIHSYYVEIDFQALPNIAPSDVISSLKSSTSKKILKKNPDIKMKYAGLWSNSYFIYTTEQAFNTHKEDYLKRQSELHSIKKMVGKE